MRYSKSRVAGRLERLSLLKEQFPELERYVHERPAGVGFDDLLDAAAAAWSAYRIWQGVAESVCLSSLDPSSLMACIHF
jgi:hypothetical protein